MQAVLAGRPLPEALARVWQDHPHLTPQQRGAIQDISYGTLRCLGTLDATLGLLTGARALDAALRCLLLCALYQLRHTLAKPYAVVNHAVEAADRISQPRAKGLVNAVLRKFSEEPDAWLERAAQEPVGRYSHPLWWIDKLKTQLPEHFEAVLAAGNRHPPMSLRVNPRRDSPPDYLEALSQAGIPAAPAGGAAVLLERPVAVSELPGFWAGRVSVQDWGAQQAAFLLDVAEGMEVLDACAAPGGKTGHILELADCRLVALDADAGRLRKVDENLRRLGLRARLVAGDAAHPETWWDGRPFQRILADVPCSASGVAGRHPDIKWLRRESDIPAYAERQAAILDGLWRLLDRGGKLLYATCSVFREEDHQQAAMFLDRHPDASPLEAASGEAGLLLPDRRHDGFFYALFQKR